MNNKNTIIINVFFAHLLRLCCLILLGLTLQANAFQLSPVVAALEPSGIKAEQVYLLTNTGANPAAVEFSVTTRQQRSNGSEIRKPAENLFSVHPEQVVIPSGGTQKVRLRWLGRKPVIRELAYRFIAKELPIKLSKEPGMHINMVMTMETAVYIRPTGQAKTKPNTSRKLLRVNAEQRANQTNTTAEMLQVNSVMLVNTPKGKRLALTVKNPAREHIILKNIQVRLMGGGQTITLRGAQLGNMRQQNLLAGSVRNFMLPIPNQFTQQQKWKGQLQTLAN